MPEYGNWCKVQTLRAAIAALGVTKGIWKAFV